MSKMGEIAAGLYPDGLPGWKTPGTSRDAAKAIRTTANAVREKILMSLAHHPKGCTTDEMCAILGISVLSGRPRFSELFKQGKIRPTDERRTNDSGMSARVWVLA